jgi:prepilin-type N-terminal cleavage/methylation domain-containing protein
MNRRRSNIYGFSLVELIVAMMVLSIVLSAVVTLSYALSSAYESTSDIGEKQARVRYTNLRMTELIRHSKLVCAWFNGNLVVWRADDNNDNKINISEIVYIETEDGDSCIRLLQFTTRTGNDWNISLGLVQWPYLKNILSSRYPQIRTTLIDKCDGMNIILDKNPPYTQNVNIVYNIEEDERVRTYQISANLRCWAGHLIDTSYRLVTQDDD